MKNIIKPKILFILGPPGSGKGTQSELISKTFNFYHLSAGQLLREESEKENSSRKEIISSYINTGRIIPFEITLDLLKRKINLENKVNNVNQFLIDGFPRNKNNLNGWKRVIGDDMDVVGTVCIELNKESLRKRLVKRGRGDDKEEVFEKRMTVYYENKEVYSDLKEYSLFIEVDGDGSVNEVFQRIVKRLRYIV